MSLSQFSEYGLIGLIVGVLFFIVWRLLVWVMKFVNDITLQQNEERKGWHGTLEKHNDLINKISDSIDRHDERADERGKFVRSEHEKMLMNLHEQTKILIRINGFKHE